MMKQLAVLSFTLLLSGSLFAQTPCENGQAGGFPCDNIDLLGQVSPEEMGAVLASGMYVNDIWGWTDPETGKEYVVLGMTNGTAFIDITDPLNPVVLGVLPEPEASQGARYNKQASAAQAAKGTSLWRDVKVYANHAFIVSDNNSEHGMQVFDLTQLRNVENPPATFSASGHYDGIGEAHNVVINESEGYAYIVGARGAATCGGGGLHIVDIRDPKNPAYAGCFDDDGYTHDAQVVSYQGPDESYQGKEVAFAANADAFTIVDVSDKTAPGLISTQSYSGVEYVHQGWLTEDHAYFISNDELDESRNGHNTRTYIWDVRDLDNPTLIGTFTAETPSIDHNLYIRDGLVYASNYTSGLRVLSLSGVAEGELKEVAYFDTHPDNNAVNYNGTWSNYPYFKSGVIAVSDVNRGLLLLQPTLETVAAQPENAAVCEGEPAVYKVFTPYYEASYQWQADFGEGYVNLSSDADYEGYNTYKLQVMAPESLPANTKFRVLVSVEGGDEFSEAAGLVINELPEAAFSYEITESDELVLQAEGDEAWSYSWLVNGDFQGSEQQLRLPYDEAATYNVTLEVVNDCGSAQEEMLIESVLGVEEDELQQALQLFPNPATGQVNLQLEKSAQQLQEVTLFTLKGQQIKQAQPTEPQKLSLSLSDLAPGLYLLQITTDKANLVQRLVIQ